MSIVQAHNVSICYPKGNFKDIGLKEYLLRKIKGTYHIEYFWADRNINFALEKGDMLGIIGTNGAGKSTLLKAVSGVMEPTRGHVSHKGTISSLLELGGGFDRNMTVRENTFLRGALLDVHHHLRARRHGAYRADLLGCDLRRHPNRQRAPRRRKRPDRLLHPDGRLCRPYGPR